jgi:predicted PurR-regulated permease PerM
MVNVLRSAAEQMLAQVVDDGIEAAAPDIEKSALRTAMDAQFTDIAATIRTERAAVTSHVDRRTSFLTSFLTNLAAWAVTLFLAVVIVYLFNRPSPEQTILTHTQSVTQQTPAPQPTVQPAPLVENRSSQ